MSPERIGVGIVGASPDRGWAARAHVPALRALPGLDLTAVATSRADSAREAQRRFGAAHAFTDARALAEHPDVDLVAITVRVPAHAELVRAAVGAGKHVYCEWPLALDTAEAEALVALAERAGVRHAVGLQARLAPAVAYARELVAGGYVGRVTSATVYSSRGKGAAERIPAWSAYTYDVRTGAGLLEVANGHTLDAVRHVLGEIADVSAALSVQRPRHTVEETGETVEATAPDQLVMHGTLAGGGVISVHVHDAKLTDGRTRVEIAGTEGDLVIESGELGPYGVQISALRLLGSRGPSGTWEELTVPDRHRLAPDAVTGPYPGTEALHVARFYAAFAEDIRTGGHTVPDFTDGLRVHRLLDAIRESARTRTWK